MDNPFENILARLDRIERSLEALSTAGQLERIMTGLDELKSSISAVCEK